MGLFRVFGPHLAHPRFLRARVLVGLSRYLGEGSVPSAVRIRYRLGLKLLRVWRVGSV